MYFFIKNSISFKLNRTRDFKREMNDESYIIYGKNKFKKIINDKTK